MSEPRIPSLRPYQGRWPAVGARAWLDPLSVVIGDVELGDDVSVWPFAAIRGDVHWIRVGARTNVQDNAVLHVTHDGRYTPGGYPLEIGADVTIGHAAILHGCRVGDACLVGMGAVVMDGAVLEDGCMVAAGAVVTPGTVVRAGTLVRGNPAREARPLSDTEREMIRYNAAHYVRLKDRYLDETGG